MNNTPTPHLTHPDARASKARSQVMADSATSDELPLREYLIDVWMGRRLVLGVALGVFAFVALYSWITPPSYRADALLQIEDRGKNSAMDALFSKLNGIFTESASSDAEIAILKSRMVLGRSVQALGLDHVSYPQSLPFIGGALMRGKTNAPKLSIASMSVPKQLLNTPFSITLMEDGSLLWETMDNVRLASGKPGELLTAKLGNENITLKIETVTAKPGQQFMLIRKSLEIASQSLLSGFQVKEKAKESGILQLAYETHDPYLAERVLNEIMRQYTRQNIERKTEEASRSIQFLQGQMPELQRNLERAEDKLNQYRSNHETIDLSAEVQNQLKQSAELQSQILLLELKKVELSRLYTPEHPQATALAQQINKLRDEEAVVNLKIRELPVLQQEVVRLMRDVQVSTDLYTSVLANMQQLKLMEASEIGNVRIIDEAIASPTPVKPNKIVLLPSAFFAGLLVGAFLVVFRKALHPGIEDPRIIEAQTGLPVLSTIPHSTAQENLYHKICAKDTTDVHLLVHVHPSDLASESLRSLRTNLHFLTHNASNHVILVAGPAPSIGKSFVTSNLAAVMALSGSRVLLIDGDMRRGHLHQYFGYADRGEGCSGVLAGHQTAWTSLCRPTAIPGLDLLTSGKLPPNPSELLMSENFTLMLSEAQKEYEYVLIDAPPVLAVTDAAIIAPHVGTILLLAKAGTTSIDEIQLCEQRLTNSGGKVSGCVLNDLEETGVSKKYYRYAYHYKYN